LAALLWIALCAKSLENLLEFEFQNKEKRGARTKSPHRMVFFLAKYQCVNFLLLLIFFDLFVHGEKNEGCFVAA